MGASRASPGAIAFSDTVLLVVGGDNDAGTPKSDKETFDGSTWSGPTALGFSRGFAPLVLFGSTAFLLGGFDGFASVSQVMSGDPSGIAASGTLPGPRAEAGAAVLDGRMYLAAGSSVAGLGGQQDTVYSSSDGTQWTLEGHLPAALWGGALVAMH
jgi:hypothetical protein